MNHDQFEKYISEMKVHVADTIRVTVNGKIDGMRKDLAAYIDKDEAWKKTAQPAIDIVTNVSGFGKVVLYGLGFIAAAGAAWIALKHLIKL